MNLFNKQNNAAKKILKHHNTAILISARLPLCLTGCMGVYEGGFECPPGEGIKCKSISEVNQTVNHWADQSSILRNEMLEDGDQERESRAEKASVCQHHGSCSAVSDIWYSPFFKKNQQEKKKLKVFNVPTSI